MKTSLISLNILLVTFGIASSQTSCPYAWSTKRYSETWPCYLVTNKIQRTWSDAKTFCQWMGGDLLKLESVQERDWVFSTLKSYTGFYPTHTEWWIGLHDSKGQVTWSDGSVPQANLLPWVPGEPAQYDHSKACVEYYNGSLRHQACTSKQFFVCKRPRESAVWCDALHGWESINSMCYKLLPKMRTWDDARGECQTENSDLVVVNDASTATVVNNFAESRKANLWIGLRAYKNSTVTSNGGVYFSWLTQYGARLNRLTANFDTQTALNNVISSNFNQSCVFTNSSLTMPNLWQTGNCAERRFSLCQKPEGRCSAGWVENNFVCYLFIARPKSTWMDAKNYCQQRGATLLHVQSPSEQTFINTNMGTFRARGIDSIWLGLSDNNGDSWTWADGGILAPQSPYMYNNLNGQNPVNRPGMQCFTIYTDDVNGTWQLAADCASNKSFICQIPAQRQPLIPTTPAPSGPTTNPTIRRSPSPATWSSDCGPFWIKDPKTGYCYKFFDDDALTWFQARHSCESQGAQLASINSYREQTFIIDFVFGFKSPGLWIGVNTLNTGTGFNWIDGTGFGYINWAPGEPNNYNNNEHCAELVVLPDKMGLWNDNRCNDKRGYMCKKRSTDFPTPPPPTQPSLPAGKIFGCPDATWLGYGNNCFLIQQSNLSWTDSRAFCESQGYNLASIASENEQNFVFSQIPANTGYKYQDQFWIGLNDMSVQMRFQWTDGSPVHYTNWEVNEPNNYQDRREDCVTMYHEGGRWNDAPCYTARTGFVCKTPKSVLPSTTKQADLGQGCSVPRSVGYGYMCYTFNQGNQTWDDANLHCASNQGTLASIHDRYQQAFLASQIAVTSAKYYWVGLSDKAIAGQLAWIDGTGLDFTAWSANHTGNARSTCISMRTKGPGVGLWQDQTCVTQLPYICQYPRTGFSTPLITATTTNTPPTCPDGWIDYNGFCYKFYKSADESKTWFGARDFCQSIGADLMSIHSSTEQSQVFSYRNLGYISTAFWIGLSDFGKEQNYQWTDGTAVNYFHWGTGEPNDSDGTEDCIEYKTRGNYWNDNSCYIAKPFACKITKGKALHTPKPTVATTMPAGCGGLAGWKLFNGSCYLTSDNVGTNSRRTWYAARDFCNQQGAELASIHSEQENSFLITLVSLSTKQSSWIGLKDIGQNDFRWSDDSLLDYIKWSGGEPNDGYGSEKCAQMLRYNGYWNDNNCNENYHFICKKPYGMLNAITVPPTPTIIGGCPSGYTGVKNGNKCFKIFGARTKTDRKDYGSAFSACRSQGHQFDIASLNSHLEIATVVSMLNGLILDDSDVWIGLNDQNNNNQFTWQDSSRLLIANWDKGQPNRAGGKCVAMSSDSRHAGKWHNLRCATIRPYVCETLRNSTISPSPTPGFPSCQGKDYVSNGLDCFKVHTEKAVFSQAETICTGEGAHLASVMSVYEQAYIDTLTASLNMPVWIGLRDPGDTGTYSWLDNSLILYSNWDKGEPTYQAGEGCVSTKQGFWSDSQCQTTYPFICKVLFFTPPTPTGYPSGFCRDVTWRQHGDYCYYVSLDSLKTWSEADQDCVSRGMQLVSIADRNEENFVLQELDHSSQASVDLWLGFKRLQGHYQWLDHTTIGYINWETYRGTYDCVKMKALDGKWQDVTCNNRLGYVCKTSKLPATSPTTPTTTISTTPTTTISTSLSSSTSTSVSSSPSSRVSSISTSTTSSSIRPSSGIVTPRDVVPSITPVSPQKAKQSSQTVGTDLSGGQVAGVILSGLLLISIVCGILFFIKRRSNGSLFDFSTLRNEGSSGFDNATYDTNMQSVEIIGHSAIRISAHGNGFVPEYSQNGIDTDA